MAKIPLRRCASAAILPRIQAVLEMVGDFSVYRLAGLFDSLASTAKIRGSLVDRHKEQDGFLEPFFPLPPLHRVQLVGRVGARLGSRT